MSGYRPLGGAGGSGAATVVLGPDFGAEADLVEQAAVAMLTIGLTGVLTAAEEIGHAEALTMALTAAESIAHAEMQTMAMVTDQADITLLRYATSAILAAKDSWCDVIAGCVSDVTHDGTDLSCDGIIASRKDVMIGWDLSGLPAGATVLSATVTLQVTTVSVTGGALTLSTIAQAAETWTEAAVKCSNIPAVDATANTPSAPTNTAGVDTSWILTSAALTRIAARMGVGTFSLRGALVATGTLIIFESADEGTNNAAGPRLEIVWSVPA